MDEVKAVIKYFCKKGMFPKEIHADFIKTFGNESLSYRTAKLWAAKFRRGRESVEDYERSGLPKVATTDKKLSLCKV